MSATLTWRHAGLGTKTNTTNAALIDDLATLVNTKSGDANYKWQVASSNSATSPLYLVLKRKDGSAGRILLVIWSSAPAGNNAAILDQAPGTNSLYGAFFPAGNVDTPSNLASSSGTILGNDAGAVKVWAGMSVSTIYAALVQPFYFDSEEAVYFGFQNPAANTPYLCGAGYLYVDNADQEYAAVMSWAATSAASFGTGALMGWSTTANNAGSATACGRSNYGGTNRVHYFGWSPVGSWPAQNVGPADILTDTSNTKAWFMPARLLGLTKGAGFALKLRQFGYGPSTTGPFTPYNTTGPVVAARQFNAATAGGNGNPWLTNFKI